MQVKHCHEFQKGQCQRGDHCKFQHQLSISPLKPPSSTSPSSYKKGKHCFSFQRGECERGDQCKFLHSDSHCDSISDHTPVKSPSSTTLPITTMDTNETHAVVDATIFKCDQQKENYESVEHNHTMIGTSMHTNQQQMGEFPVIVEPRPQMDVPGFEGVLSCCIDWPQTKKGGPPGAQSAIFNPLLACALGYIPNHCTKEQVEYAIAWWSAVFPAYPRWVEELRIAGLSLGSAEGKKLMSSVTTPKNKKNKSSNNPAPSIHSNSNNLIFKLSKDVYGDVPHFKGRSQNDALELSPMTAVEVYACITCLYSLAEISL